MNGTTSVPKSVLRYTERKRERERERKRVLEEKLRLVS